MEKKTYLSFIKTVKYLALFVFIFATAFMMTTQRTHAAAGTTFQVNVKSGYLAFRSEKAFDKSNEIGQLNTGDLVEVTNRKDSTYWYAYSPKLDKSGYVDKNYIKAVESESTSNDSWTVKVKSGYLALRNTAAYNDSNEIGRLNTGDTVLVKDSSDSTYWYVYSPKLDKYGYTNCNYLANSAYECNVRVQSGYLALRTEKAFKSSNEIGKLYTGDTVQIADSSDSSYWLVYAPGLGKGGYVNKDYLVDAVSVIRKTVKVTSGYLALRSEMAYDDENEIGRLNTGDIVQIADSSDSTYWRVYSERLGKFGYVNKNYLQ